MRVNRDRRDDLTRQFQSVSAKSTLLELFGVLDFSTLEIMDKVRTYRNNVAHRKASSLDSEMTQQAISLANDMIARRWQLDLIPNLSFTLMIL